MNRKNYGTGFIGQAAFGKTGAQGAPTHPNRGHFSCVMKDVCFMVAGGGETWSHLGTDTKKRVIIVAVIMKYSYIALGEEGGGWKEDIVQDERRGIGAE